MALWATVCPPACDPVRATATGATVFFDITVRAESSSARWLVVACKLGDIGGPSSAVSDCGTIDAGIPVASHSDAPVAEADALLRIQDLVTRRSAEGKVYGASQRISPAQALRIWTLGGAYATFEESQKGSITVGKFADFVVLGADPLAAPPDTIKDIAVELTVVGGRIVHDAAALRAAARSRTNARPAPLKP